MPSSGMRMRWRVSIVHYNTAEEIDRLIAVLDPLL